MDEEIYAELAGRGPHDAALGHAFISLVEPHPGFELKYTRWYEDDHFYSGAMAFPWWFAGRRWLAPADLRALRAASDRLADLDKGWTLGTYWISAHRLAEQARWLEAAIPRLREQGRMFEQRTHVMTGYFDLRAEWQRLGHQPRAIHSLDYPYKGLVLEILDPRTKPGFHDWLRECFVPQHINDRGIAQCLWFGPLEWPGAGETSWFDYASANADRVLLVWLLEEDPRESWQITFREHLGAIEHAGLASLAFIGGFVPALPGTDRYLDEIR